MAVVYVPIEPILEFWRARQEPHQHLRCVCNDGGWCDSVHSLARRVGVSRETMFRRIRGRRIDTDEADDWAVACGVHPSAVWKDWDRLKTCWDRDCDREPAR